MFRLYFSIFWNRPAPHGHHGKEGGFAMLLPLVLLAVGAVSAGFIPFGRFVTSDGMPLETSLHLDFSIAPVAIGLAGILLAAWMYRKESPVPGKVSAALNGIYDTVYNKFYFDELYLFVTRNILFNLVGRPAAWFDRHVVDGLVDLTGKGTLSLSEMVKRLQSGKVQQYAGISLAALLVLALIVIYFVKPA
jgi:NADH-quinone oxidoreductase subunit L